MALFINTNNRIGLLRCGELGRRKSRKGSKPRLLLLSREEPVLVDEIRCVLGLLLWEHIEIGFRTRWLAQEGGEAVKLVKTSLVLPTLQQS